MIQKIKDIFNLLDQYENVLRKSRRESAAMRFKDDANPNYVKVQTKIKCYKTMVYNLKRTLPDVVLCAPCSKYQFSLTDRCKCGNTNLLKVDRSNYNRVDV